MSSLDPWIFGNLTLKHIATVKYVQVLWKQSKAAEEFRNVYENFFRDPSTRLSATRLKRAVQRFELFVDLLTLAKSTKDNLCVYLWQMYKFACDWFTHILAEMNNEGDPNVMEKALFFIDNMTWDNSGYIDGKAMVELYVSTRKKIDYHTWVQLCRYASEDYIYKLTATVDWSGRKFCYTAKNIYWYGRVHKRFPTEDMFHSPGDLQRFQQDYAAGKFDYHRIYVTLFEDSYSDGNLAAVKYSWNKLTEDQKFELSRKENFFTPKDDNEYGLDAIGAYLFTQRKFQHSPQYPGDCGPWKYMLSWPSVLFIKSWIHEFSTMGQQEFGAMFVILTERLQTEEKTEGIREFTRRRVRGNLLQKYYVPCAILWIVCCEKFGLMDTVIFKIVAVIFNTGHASLCRIIWSWSGARWRKICYQFIINFYAEFGGKIPNHKFRMKFRDEILVNAAERKYFECAMKFIQSLHSQDCPWEKLSQWKSGLLSDGGKCNA